MSVQPRSYHICPEQPRQYRYNSFDSPYGSKCLETSCTDFLGHPQGGVPGSWGLSIEPLGCPHFAFTSESIATEYKKSQRNTTEAQFSLFFKGFDSQRQPETAQRVDLMFRDVNKDRNELDCTSSCGGEERKHDRGVQGMYCFHFFEGRNS